MAAAQVISGSQLPTMTSIAAIFAERLEILSNNYAYQGN
jgi:hypothetical protein